MALTDKQQLEYDVFLRNNPGDQGRASEALGFDTTGAQVRSANDDPGNWDVSAARGDEAPGVQNMIDRDRASWEGRLREEAQRAGLAYDPSDLAGVIRAVSHSSNVGKNPAEFLRNQIAIYGQRRSNTPGGVQAPPTTAGSGAGGGGGGGGGSDSSSYGALMDSVGSDWGMAPAPFSETYTPLARPSYLQGEYVPGQWGETFAPPAKPSVLETPYALPTQAEFEASPGYLTGESAMRRGMERSAAAKGSILSGGFVGRTLPRAMGEYAGTAYGNLVGQTLGARQQQHGEYQGDVSNAFAQYQQRYGQFADAEGLKLGARNTNEAAFQGDQGTNLGGFKTRYGMYLDQAGMKRQAENDLWSRNRDLSDLSLRAAALARP